MRTVGGAIADLALSRDDVIREGGRGHRRVYVFDDEEFDFVVTVLQIGTTPIHVVVRGARQPRVLFVEALPVISSSQDYSHLRHKVQRLVHHRRHHDQGRHDGGLRDHGNTEIRHLVEKLQMSLFRPNRLGTPTRSCCGSSPQSRSRCTP